MRSNNCEQITFNILEITQVRLFVINKCIFHHAGMVTNYMAISCNKQLMSKDEHLSNVINVSIINTFRNF